MTLYHYATAFRALIVFAIFTTPIVVYGDHNVTVEDNSGTGGITYSGSGWERTTSIDSNSPTHVPTCSANGVTDSFTVANFVDFAFTGTAVYFQSVTDTVNRPNYAISLDGQVLGTFDGRSSSFTCSTVFSKTGLSNTTHTLRITNSGPAGTGQLSWMNIDSFIYTVPDDTSSASPSPSAPATAPTTSSPPVGPIVGGVVGGVALIVILVGGYFYWRRRQVRYNGPQPLYKTEDLGGSPISHGPVGMATHAEPHVDPHLVATPWSQPQAHPQPNYQSSRTPNTPFQIVSHTQQPSLVTSSNRSNYYPASSVPPSSYGQVRSEAGGSSVAGGSMYGPAQSEIGSADDDDDGINTIVSAASPPRPQKSAAVGQVQRHDDEGERPPSYQPSRR